MELLRLITPPEPCPYLTDETACFDVRYIQTLSAEVYESLLQRGWRRFGHMFFRPVCAECQRCISIRLPVNSFAPNRSQRRALAANADLEVTVVRPKLDAEHFDLYDRYHADMTGRKEWPERTSEGSTYRETFVDGAGSFGFEIQYRLEGKLVAVALTDILPTTLSSVYCYYEPELRRRGLGIFSILKQMELCRVRGLSYQHLGYWVMGSASMAYKTQFEPHEVLKGRPNETDVPTWVQVSAPIVEGRLLQP